MIDEFQGILKRAVETRSSDVHVSAGGPFRMRSRGELLPVEGSSAIEPKDAAAIATEIVVGARKTSKADAPEYLRNLLDLDCSYSLAGVGRFRVNICSQRGSFSIVLRTIADVIPEFSQLELPPVLEEIAFEDRGLVLVTGTTGSGKTTTLASMVGHVNQHKCKKIVTIEDPIEYLHRDIKSNVIQREVGSDTTGFQEALRAALRQDPDIIMIGEMRDRVTIDIALKAAETGHLVYSTVHTADAPRSIARLTGVFDASEQQIIRQRLAESLRAVVSQRLLPRADGPGRVVAAEIMRHTSAIEACIIDADKTPEIMELIAEGHSQYGMQTFDQHLMALYSQGRVTMEVAKAAATSPADFERNQQFQ
jgi:twitching motility protein PilT